MLNAALIQAFVTDDPEPLEAASGSASSSRVRAALTALAAHARAMAGSRQFDDAVEKFQQAHRPLPDDATATLLVLSAGSHALARCRAIEEAEQWRDEADEVAREVIDPVVRAFHECVRAQLQGIWGDFDGAIQTLERARGFDLEAGSPMWFRVRTGLAACLLCLDRVAETAPILEELEPYEHLDQYSTQSLDIIRLRLMVERREFEAGLAMADQIESDGVRLNPRSFLLVRLELLNGAGRHDEVERLIDSAPPGVLREHDELNMRATLALVRGENDQARKLANQALASSSAPDPLLLDHSVMLVASAELATGNAERARRLLERLARDRSMPLPRGLWVRLALLEEDWDRAVELMAELLSESEAAAMSAFDNVREIDAGTLVRLWSAARHRLASAPGSAPDRARETETSPPPDPTTTLGRRARLRELFQSYRRLTRRQTAQLLDCAPATAANDLAALQEEGLIERHNPSAHPRTSYFELVDRG